MQLQNQKNLTKEAEYKIALLYYVRDNLIRDFAYQEGSAKSELRDLTSIEKEIFDCGFQKEWLDDPIIISLRYNISEAMPETNFVFSQGLFYDRLKYMIENPIDC